MLQPIAAAVVALTGSYLVALGVVSLLRPALAKQFLGGFAGTGRRHYAEVAVRLIAGSALVLRAPSMRLPDAFTLAGWVLILTTAVLAVMPWRWHRRFAERTVPQAVRHIGLIGVGSCLLGGLTVASVLLGPAAR